MNLITTLITDPATRHILFIGALRDNEVTGSHPLMLWTDEIRKAKVAFNQISLHPFDKASVNQFIAETLKCDVDSSEGLAELIYQKTEGNPFFVNQFLNILYEDKILTFSVEQGWEWNIDKLHKVKVADNIVDLMILKIRNLSEGSHEVLKLASIIGNSFDVETLATLCGKHVNDTYSELVESVHSGLILPTETGYKFMHDRIQEAADALIPEEEKIQLHYNIGRLILKTTNLEKTPEKIFSIVSHLNFGMKLIANREEQVDLARLNLMAGLKARAVTAYDTP